ncbi:hypothetical protein QUA79_22740 [Microcoleus sp. F8-D1]
MGAGKAVSFFLGTGIMFGGFKLWLMIVGSATLEKYKSSNAPYTGQGSQRCNTRTAVIDKRVLKWKILYSSIDFPRFEG